MSTTEAVAQKGWKIMSQHNHDADRTRGRQVDVFDAAARDDIRMPEMEVIAQNGRKIVPQHDYDAARARQKELTDKSIQGPPLTSSQQAELNKLNTTLGINVGEGTVIGEIALAKEAVTVRDEILNKARRAAALDILAQCSDAASEAICKQTTVRGEFVREALKERAKSRLIEKGSEVFKPDAGRGIKMSTMEAVSQNGRKIVPQHDYDAARARQKELVDKSIQNPPLASELQTQLNELNRTLGINFGEGSVIGQRSLDREAAELRDTILQDARCAVARVYAK
jgi:hypothetical protein